LEDREGAVAATSVGASATAAAGAPGDDGDLVARLRAGDEHAFTELVRRDHAALVRLARAYVADRDTAEEVVQEAWFAVIRGIDRYEGRSSLRTWISRIVTYQAMTRGVRERRTIPFSVIAEREAGDDAPSVEPARFQGSGGRYPGGWADPPAAWGDGEHRVLGEEFQRLVAEALETVPPAQRLVMQLRDLAGWKSEEVCEALQITPGNQRVLLHRARSRVRGAVEQYVRDAAM
jgi:RNA polymerase sigma-70 factor (ECF subfamily)